MVTIANDNPYRMELLKLWASLRYHQHKPNLHSAEEICTLGQSRIKIHFAVEPSILYGN